MPQVAVIDLTLDSEGDETPVLRNKRKRSFAPVLPDTNTQGVEKHEVG